MMRLCVTLVGLVATVSGWAGDIGYNRDIRPLLSEMCFRCHGPDSAARKAELRLDRREAAIESGAIVPGKPNESEALRRIFSTDPEEVMPPPAPGREMSPEQKELVRKWIEQGAEYEPHWSFIAPTRPTLPAVSKSDWVRNPIDLFILSRLEQAGLSPAPEADRRTLARRLSLDLVGLPPNPEQVQQFVDDTSENAYEAYVDRLLQLPHWGEHRGRYWLDVARYADTHGIHFDNFREMWSYRDWVINAFNRNMPFDQFTVEQLAGDLLPNRTLDQQIASGFNRCNMTTNEGGAIAEEYLVLYTRDRTETVSATFMGLTANCATCHDHKYDPLSQKEFYQMSAFFNNTTQSAMDGNIKDTPPIIPVPKPEDRDAFDRVGAQIVEVTTQIDRRLTESQADFEAWQTQTKPESIVESVPKDALAVHAPLSEGSEKTVTVSLEGQAKEVIMPAAITWDAGFAAPKALKTRPECLVELPEAGNFEYDQPFACGAWIKLPAGGMTGAVVARMDEASAFRGWDLWIQNNRPGIHLVNSWPDNALKVVSKTELQPGIWYHVMITYQGNYRFSGIKIYINGVEAPFDVEQQGLKSTIKNSVPLKLAQRNASARLDDLAIQDLRLYSRALTSVEALQLATSTRVSFLVGKPAAERSEQETGELKKWWLDVIDSVHRDLSARRKSLESEQSAIRERGTIAHVQQEKPEMAMAYVLHRGEYDKRRDSVEPITPSVLPPMSGEMPRNRLGFAQWLLSPAHPLTARVTVNRFWQDVFGTGLVKTSGDFGTMGELPSHPELLDWLAVEFRETGWDVKRLFKLMVMSSTYRQAAQTTPEKLEKDPENRLLARGPRFRMDAEMVRDYALSASGLLVPTIGGPSVKPYQPEGVWEAVAMIGSNTRDYKPDSGSNLYRRSMYTFWKRAAPPASMEIFNAPNREICSVRRERTNTPLQALVTLNDPQFVEAARNLAERTLKEGGSTEEDRIDYLVRRLRARSLTQEELAVVKASLGELSAYYADWAEDANKLVAFGESKPAGDIDPRPLASWTMLTNQLMNLDEVLNK